MKLEATESNRDTLKLQRWRCLLQEKGRERQKQAEEKTRGNVGEREAEEEEA